MSTRIYITSILFFFGTVLLGQSAAISYCDNPAFQNEIDKYLAYSVPIISVKALSSSIENYTLLDARELKEYEVSHINGAIHVGYNSLNYDVIKKLDKTEPIVIYCSIGYRSEKIGEYLLSTGFENVYNLYGSIFEWANQGNVLVNSKAEATKRLHTFNKDWSQWVLNEQIEKVIR